MSIKLYSTESSSILIESKRREIYEKVEHETEDFILNAGEEKYIEYLKSEFEFDFPEILFDQAIVDSTEEEIEARYFPGTFDVEPYKFYKRNIIIYEIPYSGQIHLLKFRPSQFSLSPKAEIDIDERNNIIKIKIIDFYNDPSRIMSDFNDAKKRI